VSPPFNYELYNAADDSEAGRTLAEDNREAVLLLSGVVGRRLEICDDGRASYYMVRKARRLDPKVSEEKTWLKHRDDPESASGR
jgi:hypothetical protein